MAAVRAGLVYFSVVFAAGFVLGMVRILLLVPHLGVMTSVALEIPVMLALSWLACGAVLRRFPVSSRLSSRLAMGGVALAFLWLAETLLTVALGGSAASFFAGFETPAGALGAAAQVAFAAIPLVRRPAAA